MTKQSNSAHSGSNDDKRARGAYVDAEPDNRARLAALRSKHRTKRDGLVVLPAGGTAPWQQVVAHSAESHQRADRQEFLGVEAARAAGASWDAVSAAMGGWRTGEALRLKYAVTAERRSSEARRIAEGSSSE